MFQSLLVILMLTLVSNLLPYMLMVIEKAVDFRSHVTSNVSENRYQ